MSFIKLDASFLYEDIRNLSQQFSLPAQKGLSDLIKKQCLGAEMTGWFNYPAEQGQDDLYEIKDYAQHLDVVYDLVVIIGIGGSALGAQALNEALMPHFFERMKHSSSASALKPLLLMGNNLSEDYLIHALKFLDQHRPIFVVVSKTGTTLEPGLAFRFIQKYSEQRFGESEAKQRTVFVTDPSSGGLRKLAEKEGYRAFSVPTDIGGRYSVFTAVGLLPLALCGIDVQSLMQGAIAERLSILECVKQNEQHPVLQYASMRMAAYESGRYVELMVYSEPRLSALIEWWKQLFGESEGKQTRGIFPASALYSRDLHSLGQYVQDGRKILLETFLNVENPILAEQTGAETRLRVPQMPKALDQLDFSEGLSLDEINKQAMSATRLAHFDGSTPSLELSLKKLDARHLGALMMFFMTSCAVSSSLLGVNAFDQPGVEAYKQNMFALLGKPGFESRTQELKQRLKQIV